MFWLPLDWLSCHVIYIQSKFLSENINKHQSTICYIEKNIYPVVICLRCLHCVATHSVKAFFFAKGILKNNLWLNV